MAKDRIDAGQVSRVNTQLRMIRVSFATTKFGRAFRPIGIKITPTPRKHAEIGMVTDTRMAGSGQAVRTPSLVATVVDMHIIVTLTPQHMTRNMYVQLEYLGGAFD